jgi:PAS domain S-box-containing protein
MNENVATLDSARLLSLLLTQPSEHALIILDPQGTIVHWLAGAENVFGYSAEEVIAKPHVILFTPEDVEADAPMKELEIADAGSPAEDDRWMLRKDGVRFWATGVLQAIKSPSHKKLGYFKVLRNRTDLKGQIEKLENDVAALQEANRRKNSFISTLAHELRNPLSSLALAMELVRPELPTTDETSFALSSFDRQMEAMLRLVEDLLEVTRVHTGKVQLALEDVSLTEILKGAAETCCPHVGERTHELHLILGRQPVFIRGDAVRLRQVFVNLIENAAKYTEFGGQIWVKLLLEGAEAVVKVEDTGIGISPDVLPQIFDLFTQGEFDRTRENTGLGIGLSVVQDITRLHGGTVQVRSDGIGKGSEFTVRLPLSGPDGGRPDSMMGASGK